ncbi:MAG: tRNA (adenosine(37)-N6)-threonylcarbamoyltransferase complex ATPase subunit type 1 TsaE [Gemmatimonadales bacterium]
MRLSADDLNAFGERLGRELPAGSVVGLSGDLGTGKTTLVQAICRGLGATVPATSPTYALVHRYSRTDGGAAPVYHVDCYRLRRPAEAADLGFDDMIRENAVVLIEWPERAGSWTPKLDRQIRLSFDADPGYRQLEAR